jgi:ribonuclease III
VYLDGGYRKVFKVISKLIKNSWDKKDMFIDHKTRLQEIAQKKYKKIPRYAVVFEEGPPHKKSFHVEVRLLRKVLGSGSGSNKKEAEQSAAREGLLNLGLLK